MNQTINVNIGGYPFIIDQNAFDKLQEYLDVIEHHFSKSEGCEEIVHDIELRFAELLTERPNKRPIIGARDIEQAIKILGTPEEFGAEEEKMWSSHIEQVDEPYKPKGKRLFRNTKDKVVGGVCSGLAAYFGMNDPIWVRLFFVVLTIPSAGLWALVYIFLLIAVPKAKTPSDRLAMRGKPVNVENIAQQVEEGIENLTYKLDEITDRWSAKKKR